RGCARTRYLSPATSVACHPAPPPPALLAPPPRRSSDLGSSAHRRPPLCAVGPAPAHSRRASNRAPAIRANRHAAIFSAWPAATRSEEHTSELQSRFELVCRLLLEKKTIEAA